MLQSADCTVLSFQKHSSMLTMKHILETAVLFLLLHCKAFHLPHRHIIVTGVIWETVMQDLSLAAAILFLFRGFHSVGEKINSVATCSGLGLGGKTG